MLNTVKLQKNFQNVTIKNKTLAIIKYFVVTMVFKFYLTFPYSVVVGISEYSRSLCGACLILDCKLLGNLK